MERRDRPLAQRVIRASLMLGTVGTSISTTAPGVVGLLGATLTMSPFAVAAMFGIDFGVDTAVTNRVPRI